MGGKASLRWLLVSLCLGMARAPALAQKELLTQSVTYDQPAQTIKQLLDTLSYRTGVRLFAPSPVDSEIVLVSVRDIPLKELMDYLAAVADGEWFKQPDGSYHLVRTPKIVKERRQQDNERILQGLKRTLERQENKQLLEPLTEQQARQHRDKLKELLREIAAQNRDAYDLPDEYWEAMGKSGQALSAGERLLRRIVQRMDLRQLLEIPVGERRVFSNVPGRFLLPLGFSVQSLLNQYVQERRLVHELWTHPTEGISEGISEKYDHLIDDKTFRREPPRSVPARLYLEVGRWAPDRFIISAVLGSEDGKDAFKERSWLYLFSSEEEGIAKPTSESPLSSEEKAQPPARVVWSERSRQFLEAYRQMMKTADAVPWPPILDPAQTEPLSLIPSDVINAYARQKGKMVAALLPDSQATWIHMALYGREVLRDYVRWFPLILEIDETEHAILIKPRFFSYEWGQRINRRALSEWIERVRQQGYLKFVDSLTLSKLICPGISTRLPHLYLELLLSPETFRVLGDTATRFVASLTPAQLSQLWSGQALSLASLTPAQREQLVRYLYFGDASLEFSPMEGLKSGVDERQTNDVGLIHVFYPDGPPAEATLQLHDPFASLPDEPAPQFSKDFLRQIDQLGVFTVHKAGVWSGFCALMDMASELHESQNPQGDESMVEYFRRRVEQFRSSPLMPARQHRFILELRLSRQHVVRLPSWVMLADYELLNEGKPVAFDALPKEMKEPLEQCLERLKTLPKDESP